MNKYLNGKIYVIICYKTDKHYYGSTYQNLNVRLSKHKYDLKGAMGLGNVERHYRTSADVLINDNYEIILIKDYPCQNKKELQTEEYRLMNLANEYYNVVNKTGLINYKKKNNKING
tara:strand:- start:436 stop:786 length:351 start_codon:yes stop_codon:yes gene_type:complete